MTTNFKDDHNGWMTNDEANHRFAFLSVPGLGDDPDKVKHNVMHHSAFEYESFSDLMSSYARMRDECIIPAFSLDYGITMSLYHKEPEGSRGPKEAVEVVHQKDNQLLGENHEEAKPIRFR